MAEGEPIRIENEKMIVPDNPIVPFIEGDGIGPDVMAATQLVMDAAVRKAYGGKRKITWLEIFAGEKALEKFGENLPS
ncbi:MAG: isocitrate/isopropylmalate family dehydrogenase, partial [Candidatus Syntropharchaeales archaeon]